MHIEPVCAGVRGYRVEVVLGHVEGESKDRDHLARERETALPEFEGYLAKAGDMGCALPEELVASVGVLLVCEKRRWVRDGGVVCGVVAQRECFFAIWDGS